ncbi:uncharacterized protein RAG0_04728 [Rhynchosporium agropyri]|uniref:Alternative oxidase n=1 Tax=Rhynchosporium agropyri TaxID=914238 RepID=A0A1E1KA02_9HELO|nr:uncharacterized protein RAG0_04728 [Rhynchosporium agropyri]
MLSISRLLTACVVVIALWMLLELIRVKDDELQVDEHISWKDDSRKKTWSEGDFISEAMISAVKDDFKYEYVAEICDQGLWDDSVVFECQNLIGGIGNLRQEILHCIRYAIDAGAGLILPVIKLRKEGDLSNLEGGTASMDYLFDKERFLSRMQLACPQMKVYQDLKELESMGIVKKTELVDPKKLSHPMTSRIAYSCRDHIKEIRAPPGQISLVPLGNLWRHFPICHDSVGFADAFGNLLPLRRDIHRLAATALYRLHTIYGVQIDPSVATTSVFADSFIGIHLRTAKDILSYWLGYEDQASYYIQRINASPYLTSLPIVFVASGNATSISDFSALQEDSLAQPKHVLTKHDLLSGDDAVELAGLTWDQQALIDYLILSRSGFFMGMADSSFAWTIAVTRRKETSAGTCAFPKGWWKSKLLGTALRDDYSDLLGKHGYGWEDKMWP